MRRFVGAVFVVALAATPMAVFADTGAAVPADRIVLADPGVTGDGGRDANGGGGGCGSGPNWQGCGGWSPFQGGYGSGCFNGVCGSWDGTRGRVG